MARRVHLIAALRQRLGEPGVAWPVACFVAALGAVLAWPFPRTLLDWQPALTLAQPWRWWTAAFVHYSPLHLGANLGATLVVATYGWAARTPLRGTVAWLLAWPLGHLALWSVPALGHYGGLSGLMHASVAVASLGLVLWQPGRPRAIGALVFAGMCIKLLMEEPWGPVLRTEAAWDIPIAPVAHSLCALAGVVSVLLVHAVTALSRRRQGWPQTSG